MLTILSRRHLRDQTCLRRTLVPTAFALIAAWLLMLVYVQVEDYFDASWEEWPEQVPVYVLSLVCVAVDLVLWHREVDEADSGVVEAGGKIESQELPNVETNTQLEKTKRILVPPFLWVSFLLMMLVHIGLGTYYSVIWVHDEDRFGKNDWNAKITTSKAMGHWITLFLLVPLALSRSPRFKT